VGPGLGGTPLGVIGTRERWRAALEVGTLSAPLGGWVELGWAEGATASEEVGAPGRVEALDRCTMLPPAGAQLLQLADVPMLRFNRRYAAGQAYADAARLLEALSGVERHGH
jgi:hypothetical protein